MDQPLITSINLYCFPVDHEHRKASDEEYSYIERKNYNKEGCYLCNNRLNNFENRNWYCLDFTTYNKHSLPIDKKIVFKMCTNLESTFYLPNELIMLILDLCVYTTQCNQIKKISPKLIQHARKCNKCSNVLIYVNSTLSCPTHLIPRKKRIENYFQSYNA
jgi:hypothetical protein